MMEIATKDLILKQGSPDDWKDLYRNLWSQESVFRYMFTHASLTEEAGQKRTAAYVKMQAEVKTEFFVYAKPSGQAIGIAGIKEIQPGVFTVTDIAIGPAFTEKGYGKQILSALVDFAFEKENADVLLYDCFTQNTASKQLAQSCGFVYSHSKEAELQKDGETVILEYYYINRKGITSHV